MKPVLIAITGGTASGKSTIARILVDQLCGDYSCALINQDHYFRDWSGRSDDETRDELRTANRPEAVMWPKLLADLDRLERGETLQMPVPGTRAASRGMEPWSITARDAIVVEGHILLWDEEFRDRCDLSVYVDAHHDERVLRRMTRDTTQRGTAFDRAVAWYRYDVRPSFPRYTEPSRWEADLIIPNVRDTTPASASVAALTAAVRALIDGRC